MKAKIVQNPIEYWKKIEYTPGTYSITIPYETTCNVILVGGGGGGHYNASAWSSMSRVGGSAAMISGTFTIPAGTYTVIVGVAGGVGGATIFYNQSAGGGGKAYANVWDPGSSYDGAGGLATVTSGSQIPTLTYSNGVKGSTISRYLTYGGGAGGAGYGNENPLGQTGFAVIEYLSDSSDYTYTKQTSDVKLYKTGTTYKAFNI